LNRAAEVGLTWPLPDGLSDEALERRLFPPPPLPTTRRPLPKWEDVHVELRRKGVTLKLLWQEYIEASPEGYSYSRFCERYQAFRQHLSVTMRQPHKAGDKLFVDYCGVTVPVLEPASGQVYQAQIFVATLGASNYTYAEATWTQSLPDWIGAHVRAFAFFGGVPRLVVPDNLRSGVTDPSYYDPDINRTYADLAAHYGTAVLPARVRKPRDKAKVEAGVQGVEQQILARIRHRQFFSLAALNRAIAERLHAYNRRPFQKLPGTRLSQFNALDQPALAPLPPSPYQFADWKKARPGIDYHVAVDGHFYSVPYTCIKKQLDVRITQYTVECFLKGERVASHARSVRKGAYTTCRSHMPQSHRAHAEWSPQRMIRWARQTGNATATVVEGILRSQPHPEHGYRACLGIMRLAKSYGDARVEAACQRALAVGSLRYRSIASILKKGLDREPLPEPPETRPPIAHANVRGPEYYQ
ncbi:MAG: IS21 family transposase, partial [Planctomycetota bacterium]